MKRFANILHAVYCEPWLIRPEMHARIAEILQQHITGAAHGPTGVATVFVETSQDEKDEAKRQPMMRMMDDVSVIEVSGVLGKRMDMMEKMSGGVDVNDVMASLDSAMADKKVKGIIMAMDTPGGTIQGIPELAQAIYEASEKKPLVAFTDTMADSAGYWLASQAPYFVVSPSASVGSIGVYKPILDQSIRYAAAGLKQEVFKAGKFKGAGVPGTSLTDAQREMVQARVDQLHAQFKAAVRAGRGRQIPDDLMEGQEFFGSEAVLNGLADECGNFSAALRAVRGGCLRTEGITA